MKMSLFVLFVTIGLSYSADLEKKIYSLSDTNYTFVVNRISKVTISEGCDEKKRCEAWSALSKVKKIALSHDDLYGGVNPGAATCVKRAGKVKVLKDSSLNETSFCQFKDKSMIANFSLMNAL
jgi:hypothetical protein